MAYRVDGRRPFQSLTASVSCQAGTRAVYLPSLMRQEAHARAQPLYLSSRHLIEIIHSYLAYFPKPSLLALLLYRCSVPLSFSSLSGTELGFLSFMTP